MDSFETQINNLKNNIFNKTMPLIVLKDSSSLNYIGRINESKTIVMRPSKVKEIEDEHFLSEAVIKKLDINIENSFLALDSRTRKECVVLFLDNPGVPNLIVALDTNAKIGYLEVNLLSSAYERKNIENYIINTYDDDLNFYKNKKTEHYINSMGLQLSQDLKFALSNSYTRQSFTKS